MKELLIIAAMLISGCSRCPMRLVAWEVKTCWQCGADYCERDGRNWHKCKGAKP